MSYDMFIGSVFAAPHAGMSAWGAGISGVSLQPEMWSSVTRRPGPLAVILRSALPEGAEQEPALDGIGLDVETGYYNLTPGGDYSIVTLGVLRELKRRRQGRDRLSEIVELPVPPDIWGPGQDIEFELTRSAARYAGVLRQQPAGPEGATQDDPIDLQRLRVLGATPLTVFYRPLPNS